MYLSETNGYWYVRRTVEDGKETVAKLGQHDDEPAIYLPELYDDKAEHVLADLPDQSIECILTDPPFGVGMKIGQRGVGVAAEGKHGKDHAQVHNHSSQEFLDGLAAEFNRVLTDGGHCYVFCNYKCYPEFKEEFESEFNLSQVLVWDKTAPGSGPPNTWLPAHEWILHLKKGQAEIYGTQGSNVLHYKRTRYVDTHKIHPTQKPRRLLETLIEKSTRPGDVVLDPFGGSYAGARAAMRTFRRSLSCELDPDLHRNAVSLTRKQLYDDPEYGVDWTDLSGLRIEQTDRLPRDGDPAETGQLSGGSEGCT